MAEPLVSIVIPVYQVKPYLRACFDSVRAQTHQELDVVVVDDGSTDGSGAICDEYGMIDPRFRVIHQRNGGLSSARNTGVGAALGDYLAFVDSDDVVAPQFVERLLSANADVAQCFFCTDEALLASGGMGFERLAPREAAERLQYDATGAYTVAWNKLYRRATWGSLQFPEGRQHEDEFVTYRAFWEASSVAVTEAPLYYYRQRPGSITKSGFSQANLDAVDALGERVTFYRDRGEERLATLTEATLCHRLRGLMPDIKRSMPGQARTYKARMHAAYRSVMGSSSVDMKKKLSLTLQMVSPGLYGRVKG